MEEKETMAPTRAMEIGISKGHISVDMVAISTHVQMATALASQALPTISLRRWVAKNRLWVKSLTLVPAPVAV